MTGAEAPEPVRGAPLTSRWAPATGSAAHDARPLGSAGRQDRPPGWTAPLAAWRDLDWRFALPPVELRTVSFVGPASTAEAEALHALGARVARIDPEPPARHADGGTADVVIVTAPSPAALDAATRTVRPGGWVLVRTSRSIRAGHPGLRVEAAPRWQRRLRRSGFEDVATLWHAPSRRTCSYIVSIGDSAGVRFVLRRWQGTRFGLAKSLAARALLALRLFPYAAGDVTVAGRAPGGGRSGADAAVSPAVLATPWFEASRHVIAITFRDGVPVCVAKMPRRPGDGSGIRREVDSLRRLAAASPAAAERGPRVLGRVSAGSDVLVEEPLSGKALGPERVRANPARAVRIGMELVDLMPVTGSSQRDARWYDRLLGAPLGRFRSDAPAEVGAAELVARTHERLRPLRDARDLPLVFEHGDLGHPNLVVRPSGWLGAVDWERSEARGLPAHDAVFFLTYLAEALHRAVDVPDRLHAFEDAFLGAGAWARRTVAAHLDRRGVDRALLPPLVLACWARSACGLLERLAGAPGPGSSEDDAAIVVEDRDVALWRHVDRIYGRLL